MDDLFTGTDVKYTIIDRKIILAPDYLTEISQQGQVKVSGTVSDKNGNPMPGVNIMVEGTNVGSISDVNGKYSIEVQNANNVLVFSFIGFVSQKVTVGNNAVINISMSEGFSALDEVIVVGYGTQKKINITGAVSNVSSDALDSKNVAKGSLALVGEMSGISVRQLSGNPNNNAAEIRIRGLGTFSSAGNNPLILVDGIESSLDNIDPNDIKSVSVLKDAASASIYGSKAANGVILVETKRGIAGAPKFSYYSYIGKQQGTMIPQMCDSWDYAVAMNEALTNVGQLKRYSDSDIQKFKSGTDPDFPNFDHLKYLWTSGSGLESKNGISISGGTPGTQYLFSTSYLNQNGIVMKNYTKRFDMRFNLNTKLMDNVNLNVNMSGNTYNGNEPSGAYANRGIQWISISALRLANSIPGATGDGFWGANETLHPEADLNSASFVGNKNAYLFGTADLAWDIFKDLKISGKVGYTYNIVQTKFFRATYPVTPTYTVSPNFLDVSWNNNTALTLQSLIEYTKSFGAHSIHILGGFSEQKYYNASISAYRDQLPNNDITEIDAGSTSNGTQGGNASENKLRSFFGRVNYSYLDKYLLEANIRYDGSSRFPKENRYGFFPSISAGWRVSKEKFFTNAVPWVYDLKIRGSWGELGNQSVGNYPYQDVISLGENGAFGNSISAGASINTIANRNITWETTRMTDAGLDISVMEGKLNLTADYYVKTTIGILYNVSASSMLGASPSPANAGSVENKGWDFNLSYKNNLGNFSYTISPNFSLVNNKVVKLTNVDKDISKRLFVGYAIGSRYGYVADGLFVDQADISNYATQPFSTIPGDIRYKDISGPNGIPDGKVDGTYDRTVIGYPMPKCTYGLSLTAKYKGFDLALLLQGEAGRKEMIDLAFFFPNDNNGNIQKWIFRERWTVENPDRNAGFPVLYDRGESFFLNNISSFWMKNATFLRLKNVQIGYTLPSRFMQKIGLDKVRIFASGENLFTIDSYYEGWDPEMLTSRGYGGTFYPLTRLWLGGINIDF